jgi:hypothetical protein
LHFQGPEVCPREAEVIATIETERGRPFADEPKVAFTAVVVPEGDGKFRLTVATDAEGDAAAPNRTLRAKSCSELVVALTRVVSLALGPPIETEQPARDEPKPARPPAKVPSPTPAPVASNSEDATRPQSPAPAARAHEQIMLGAAFGLIDTASLGKVTFGGRFEWGVHIGDIAELRAGFAGMVPQKTTADAGGAVVGAVFSFFPFSTEACAALFRTGVRVPLCAGMEYGTFSVEGRGVEHASTTTRLWSAIVVDARVGIPIGRLRLELLSGLAFPLAPESYYVSDVLIHRTPTVTARFGIGIESGN